jgi:ketosteroid isomerase-like protein
MAEDQRPGRAPLVAAFAAGALASPLLVALADPLVTWGESYRSIPVSYQRMIEESEDAFMKRDVAAAGASLTEDFSWYRVTDKGPELMVQGRAATTERLKTFFTSPAWTDSGSEVHRLGMVGNTLVQVEIDTLNMGQGPVRQTSLHVYEFRDGKRWREFAFYPKDR